MAKNKVTANKMTIVEGLYDVPSNWKWVSLDSIGTIVTGSTPSKKKEGYYGGDFPFVKPADLDQGKNVIKASEYLTQEGKDVSRVLPADSTSVCCIGSIGKTGYLSLEATTNQQINTIIPNINNLFVYYYCNTNSFVNSLQSLASATTISLVNKTKMSTVPFPVPPLPEQQRIVNRIESLFEKIDKAEALINEAREGFEKRKEAILAKAFRGELTKKWREKHEGSLHVITSEKLLELKEEKYSIECDSAEKNNLRKPKRPKEFPIFEVPNDKLPKSWTTYSFSNVVYDFKYGTSEKSDYSNTGTPVLRIPNIGQYICDTTDIKYAKDEIDHSVRVLINDILVIRSNGSKELVGKANLITDNVSDYAFASYLIRIRYVGVCPEYLMYLLNSAVVRNQFFLKSKSSVGINNINTQQLASVSIPLPTFEEQDEISKILRNLLEKEKIILNDIINLIDLDSLKKSILAKAFRGDLGTNVPSESSVKI